MTSLLSLLISSCGTLAGRKQFVSVDTNHRPNWFQLGSGEHFQAPQVLELTRDSSWTFKQGSRSMSVSCKPRWAGSILPNLGLTLVSLLQGDVSGLGLLATDWYTGAMWDCPTYLHLYTNHRDLSEAYCPNYLVLPPAHEDELVGDQLVEYWIEKQDQGAPCPRYVFNDQIKYELSLLNFSFDESLNPSLLGGQHLLQIAFNQNANGVVFLNIDPENPLLHGRYFDIHKNRVVAESSTPLGSLNDGKSRKENHFLNLALSLFPNSLLYEAPNRIWDTFSHENLDEKYNLPRFMSGFGVTRINHPRGFDAWDLILDDYVSARTHFYQLSYEQGSNPESLHEVLDLGAMLYFSIGPTLFTPVGSFGLHFQGGPTFQWVKVDDKVSSGLTLAVGSHFFYRAFVTEDVFINLRVTDSQLKRPIVNNGIYNSDFPLESALGIGWFLPQGRWLTRRLLD
ncbi:hypothetical protein [Pseudobacteriovorax antillogorgiicola]|nr:hypothetical protein [Pseudobacteriovorax antillogorgiicola]